MVLIGTADLVAPAPVLPLVGRPGAEAIGKQKCACHSLPARTIVCYFHSQSVERLFPSASTSYSKIAATLFSRDHLGEELW
jgi:hypothetical protein